MGENTMAIEIEREQKENLPSYEEMLVLKGRVDSFIDYVKGTRGSSYVGRKECAAILGFNLPDEG